MLRRERRPLRGDSRREGRDHLRRAQPRLDHRRHQALQGESFPVQEQRHGRSTGKARRGEGGRREADHDRDGRRLLDGRHRREGGQGLRSRRGVRRPRHGRRFSRDGVLRSDGARAPSSTAARWAGWTSSPRLWARRSAGASGGFTTGRAEIIDLLRQRSRPYLFSNTMAPALVAASIEVLDMLSRTSDLRERLEKNTKYFREKMTAAGFNIIPSEHPIVPVMLGDAKLAQAMAAKLLDGGHLRHRVLLSGRAEGRGPHPHPDIGRAYDGASGQGDRGVHEGRKRARSNFLKSAARRAG